MIWFFTRGPAQIDVEVRRRLHRAGYTLEVTFPDGSERVEHIDDPARLVTRTLAVQQRLIEEGWMPSSPLGGKTAPPRRVRRPAHVRYAHMARRAVTGLHRQITKRLAAAFGL
jgi:hypothetical protein